MATIGIVVHHERSAAANLAASIAAWLVGRGHAVQVDHTDAVAAPMLSPWVVDALGAHLDVALSVGGDGTMLRTVQLVAAAGTPILGVNVGHLGYLTEVDPANWEPALTRVLEGDYDVLQRMTLDVIRPGAPEPVLALNDAVVEKLEAGHTVRVGVSVSGQPAISYAADALIVSTPTGSTAYNLSAGGPIVSPRVQTMVVTPVAAHSLLGRSLVVAPDETVTIEVLSGSAVLGIDGQHHGRLFTGDRVECRLGTRQARLVSFGEVNFWDVLRTRFGMNSAP